MKRTSILNLVTFILAFCSIVYELLLAQGLSAFLENTVLRYSTTIAIYMFAMGVGSFMVEGRFAKFPVLNLLKAEIFLSLTGGFSIVFLHFVDALSSSSFSLIFFSYLLVFVIGIFTGSEIPLLMALANRTKMNSETRILAFDYCGAVFGTIIFAFLFYPKIGLVPTAFFIGTCNALSGILLFSQKEFVPQEVRKHFLILMAMMGLLFFVFLMCLFFREGISQYLLTLYLGSGLS